MEVMAIFLPMIVLSSVDFPALGRPISVTKPDLKPSPEGGAACPKYASRSIRLLGSKG